MYRVVNSHAADIGLNGFTVKIFNYISNVSSLFVFGVSTIRKKTWNPAVNFILSLYIISTRCPAELESEQYENTFDSRHGEKSSALVVYLYKSFVEQKSER